MSTNFCLGKAYFNYYELNIAYSSLLNSDKKASIWNCSLLAACFQDNNSNISLNEYTYLSPNIYWFRKYQPYIPYNASVNCNASNLK